MGRKSLLLAVALASVVSVARQSSAQLIEVHGPLTVQQAPVYLKSLNSAREKEREAHADVASTSVVEETIERVGRAFDTGDAQELESCLVAGKRRIFLSLETGDQKPGHYGPGQVRHIFGRMFREVETRAFSYDPREIEHLDDIAFLNADWTYFVLDSDEVVSERLQFKLERGKDDWRIFEIRAASR